MKAHRKTLQRQWTACATTLVKNKTIGGGLSRRGQKTHTPLCFSGGPKPAASIRSDSVYQLRVRPIRNTLNLTENVNIAYRCRYFGWNNRFTGYEFMSLLKLIWRLCLT
jgi:hypothetical protein